MNRRLTQLMQKSFYFEYSYSISSLIFRTALTGNNKSLVSFYGQESRAQEPQQSKVVTPEGCSPDPNYRRFELTHIEGTDRPLRRKQNLHLDDC